MILTERYTHATLTEQLIGLLEAQHNRIHISGMTGSMPSALAAALALRQPERGHLLVATGKEEAYYLTNDLETLLDETELEIEQKRVMLFPASYRRRGTTASDDGKLFETDNANMLMRSEVVKQLAAGRSLLVVTYPEALQEKVFSKRTLVKNTLEVVKATTLGTDFVIDVLQEYGFERVDFVVEPGQYAVRGGIIDVFSFGNEHPYRIEFFDDTVESLRTFDPVSQLSIHQLDRIGILPRMAHSSSRETQVEVEEQVGLAHYFGSDDVVWVQGLMHTMEQLGDEQSDFMHQILNCRIVEMGNSSYFTNADNLTTHSDPQPTFNKQYDLLMEHLAQLHEQHYQILITASNDQQKKRLEKMWTAGGTEHPFAKEIQVTVAGLSHGFSDHIEHLACYTDHEIFDRYHKYHVRDMREAHEALTLKELFELKPGDFVTHIDYGVGRFSGLEKITQNGKSQEVIRLIYKNNDTLYISIHGLHKISRYVGKEGVPPTLNRLGSNSWQVLKQRTKKQVKDIAKDLIALYAKRMASQGFAYSADGYLQEQLEASFMYEDTPDQTKSTRDVKNDMEARAPMDRLVCGDVGFGKTEIAIRAAFKACCDSKQVAVLVPNTILAFQHYNTFRERLEGMPVRVDYLNRFRSTKEKNQIYADLAAGKIDILVGTHAITNKNLKFKDLGLLIIDEEQKFGVSVKEKLRQMKVNVDCLTLTATPIPRTLQFSLMGARDLSVIQTPPPNRQPIDTELRNFDEALIRDAVMFEMSRGGQTFFVNNRVENLPEMAGLVQRLVPDAVVAIAHGQMEGKKVEETLMRFLEGEIDVLVATSIIENGLDIPNANTMIINNAQNFGLSDLHQMRGRVGRSNRKAFCYMLIPSYTVLTPEAQKRLKAIEEFSSIGSGFNIAMRDLDIRGAGNILGAEQSGFISEIGYETYQKILQEAIDELKESDFAELFRQEVEETKAYVRECQIETDLEVLIPDDYVTSVSERLLLYRELNDLGSEEALEAYRERLTDRFGPIPRCTQELITTITLRRKAKDLGIEKLVLRQGKMVCHFVNNPDNPFYDSKAFVSVIEFVKAHADKVCLKQALQRLSMVCQNITSISDALQLLTIIE